MNFGMMRKLYLIAFMFPFFWFVIVVGEINFCGLWVFLFKMADPLDLLSDVEMEVFVSIVYKHHSMKDKSMLLAEPSYTKTKSFTFMALTISNFHCVQQFLCRTCYFEYWWF